MTVTLKDGLFTFGSNECAEVPPKLSVGGDIANTNDSTQKNPLGVLLRFKGNVYRYVKVDAASVAAAAGGVVHWHDLDPANGKFEVCTEFALALGKNACAGILGCVVTHGYYTWIQVGGVADVFVADSTVAGDVMIYKSTDLYFNRDAVDADNLGVHFGVALEAKTARTTDQAAVLLHNMIF